MQKKGLVFVPFILLFGLCGFSQSPKKIRTVSFVIDDFFVRTAPALSDLSYAFDLVKFVRAANRHEPLRLTLLVDTTRTNYVQRLFSVYLRESQHTLGIVYEDSGGSRRRMLPSSGGISDRKLPITYRYAAQHTANDTLRRLVAEGKATNPHLTAYVNALYADFLAKNRRLTAALGVPITPILSFEMSDLNRLALPLFWQKLKEDGWTFVSAEEAMQNRHLKKFCVKLSDKVCSEALLRPKTRFLLSDFYAENPWLRWHTDAVFDTLSDLQRLGQMFVAAAGSLGKPDGQIEKLIAAQHIGGILLLKGSKKEFEKKIKRFDSLAKSVRSLPLLYSADAEPSLFNRKIAGMPRVKKANAHKNREEVKHTSKVISEHLRALGIRHNYAPVADASPKNEAIRNRAFSKNQDSIRSFCGQFISTARTLGVVSTAKHFPGHGLVKGDSHHMRPTIDGDLQEVALYRALIDSGLLSIMVGHIAVKNNPPYNTAGLPASCSRKIVTTLLKTEMNFKGLVITDALGMGAVRKIGKVALKAAQAGCDMLLMVPNEKESITNILTEMSENTTFRHQIYRSVHKILRLKICLGLIAGKGR